MQHSNIGSPNENDMSLGYSSPTNNIQTPNRDE